MNRILLFESDVDPQNPAQCVLRDHRAAHIASVLRSSIGDALRVGFVNGRHGTGIVLAIREVDGKDLFEVHLEVELDGAQQEGGERPRPPLDLLIALPRPKALKRLLSQVSQFEVDRIVLLNAARVEKPYFSTQYLEPAHYLPLLHDGMMQGAHTCLPHIVVEPLFRPFVEDRLDAAFSDARRIVLDPAARDPLAQMRVRDDERVVLAIGPDRGFVPFEIDLLVAHGFCVASLGARTLRVDTAVVAALGALTVLRGIEDA